MKFRSVLYSDKKSTFKGVLSCQKEKVWTKRSLRYGNGNFSIQFLRPNLLPLSQFYEMKLTFINPYASH